MESEDERQSLDRRPGGHHPAGLSTSRQFCTQGQGLRASRLSIVDAGAEAVERTTLTECQKAGQQGRFPAAMGAFLVSMAGQ
jgi:hypothetical protein